MFKHQPGHKSIMNTGHDINLTAILNLDIPLTLSVTSINVHSDRLNTFPWIVWADWLNALDMRITVLIGRSNLNTLLNQQI